MNNDFEDERGDQLQNVNIQNPSIMLNPYTLQPQTVLRQNFGSRLFSINSNDYSYEQGQDTSHTGNFQNQINESNIIERHQRITQARLNIQNPYLQFVNINKINQKLPTSKFIQNTLIYLIAQIPGTQYLYMPFKYKGSNNFINGPLSCIYTVLYMILTYCSYQIVIGNFFNYFEDYQYVYTGNPSFRKNDQLTDNYSEILLSPKAQLPFQTFYFQDYLINCQKYNQMDDISKLEYGYLELIMLTDFSNKGYYGTTMTFKIPFECEQVSSNEAKLYVNKGLSNYVFQTFDQEYKNKKIQNPALEKELRDRYNIPLNIKDFFTQKLLYVSYLQKFCDGNQVLNRQLQQFKRRTNNEIENFGMDTSQQNFCKQYCQQNFIIKKEIMIPEPDSISPKMYYDFVSQSKELSFIKPECNEIQGNFGATLLTFSVQRIEMLRYEGEKDDEGKKNKFEFNYKKTALELAALYFIVLSLFGFLVKYFLPRIFQNELSQRILEIDQAQEDQNIIYEVQRSRMNQQRLRQIFKSLQTLSFEELFQIINQMQRESDLNQDLREEFLRLQDQVQGQFSQVEQLITKKEEEFLNYNQQS